MIYRIGGDEIGGTGLIPHHNKRRGIPFFVQLKSDFKEYIDGTNRIFRGLCRLWDWLCSVFFVEGQQQADDCHARGYTDGDATDVAHGKNTSLTRLGGVE